MDATQADPKESRSRLMWIIFLPNDDVVAPAESSYEFKSDANAGCHSWLVRLFFGNKEGKHQLAFFLA